jgi:hypothetical protein
MPIIRLMSLHDGRWRLPTRTPLLGIYLTALLTVLTGKPVYTHPYQATQADLQRP